MAPDKGPERAHVLVPTGVEGCGRHGELSLVALRQTLGQIPLQAGGLGGDDAGEPGKTGGNQESGGVVVDEGPHGDVQRPKECEGMIRAGIGTIAPPHNEGVCPRPGEVQVDGVDTIERLPVLDQEDRVVGEQTGDRRSLYVKVACGRKE